MGILQPADALLLSEGTTPLLTLVRDSRADIQYRDTGPRDAPTVVFLHGLGSHSAAWRGVVAGLPQLRCISWDAPGFGGSTGVASQQPTVDEYVARLLAFLDALDVMTIHLVGSSWGSVIAAAFAKDHPDRALTLTLLAPNICLGGLPDDTRATVLAQLLSPSLVLEASPEQFVAMLTAPDAPAEVRMLAALIKDQTTPEGYRQAVYMMGNTDTLAWASEINVPTLVLSGTCDTLAPTAQHARPIADAISGAKLEVFASYGHLLKLECPDQVAKAILSHVSSTRVAA